MHGVQNLNFGDMLPPLYLSRYAGQIKPPVPRLVVYFGGHFLPTKLHLANLQSSHFPFYQPWDINIFYFFLSLKFSKAFLWESVC